MTDRESIVKPMVPKKKFKKMPKSTEGKLSKLQKEVSSIKKEMKQEVEIKNYDAEFATAGVSYSGTITTPLTPISQGVGGGARVGSQVDVTGIDLRYRVQCNNLAANQFIRVLLVLDIPGDNTAVVDFLYSGTVGTAYAPLGFYNRDNRANFKVLYDKIHEFDYANGNIQAIERVSIPKKYQVQFDDASTTITHNALRLLFISNVNASTPTAEAEVRIYFKDA